LSWLYGAGVMLRDTMFRLGLRKVHRLPVPVISVGNLTVGGTGKTPMVAFLVEQARKLRRKPGVLARGYRREPGAELNDEGKLLRGRFPDLPQVQQPDRVAGGRRLIREHQVDLVILDDGFQHRRLHRDRDLVLVDAAHPFPWGLLPAGDLRELPRALRRADLVVLTRAGGKTEAEIEGRRQRLCEIAGKEIPVLAAVHTPSVVVSMPDEEERGPESLSGQRVLLLSAIARPQSFEDTARELGCEVVGHVRRRDHHHHTAAELGALVQQAEAQSATLLVTEKDEAKLAGMPGRRCVLRIDLEFLFAEPSADQLGL
jgi:tetraacyldisaccharide 4'-kinase